MTQSWIDRLVIYSKTRRETAVGTACDSHKRDIPVTALLNHLFTITGKVCKTSAPSAQLRNILYISHLEAEQMGADKKTSAPPATL